MDSLVSTGNRSLIVLLHCQHSLTRKFSQGFFNDPPQSKRLEGWLWIQKDLGGGHHFFAVVQTEFNTILYKL